MSSYTLRLIKPLLSDDDGVPMGVLSSIVLFLATALAINSLFSKPRYLSSYPSKKPSIEGPSTDLIWKLLFR